TQRPHGEKSNRDNYLAQLADAVWKDHDTVQAIIKSKLEKTLKRVAWNSQAAIPMWYPSTDTMNLLLPIALTKGKDGEDHIDIALLVEKTGPDSYRGQTVLSLHQAYQDA